MRSLVSQSTYDAQVDPKLTAQCVKNLVFVGRAMHLNPDLCFAEEEDEEEEEEEETEEAGEGGNSGDEEEPGEGAGGGDGDDAGQGAHMKGEDGEEEEEEEGRGVEIDADDREGGEDDASSMANGASSSGSSSSSSTKNNNSNNNNNSSNNNNNNNTSRNKNKSRPDPLRWVFNRMSHMVVHKGEARRRAVFSWFLAMVAVHEPAVALSHMKLMLLPLRRAVLDAESGGVEPKERSSIGGGGSAAGPEKEQTSAELAIEVGRSVFGRFFSAVVVVLNLKMLRPLRPALDTDIGIRSCHTDRTTVS